MAGDGRRSIASRVYSSDCVDPGTIGKVTKSAIGLAVAIFLGGVYELE